MYFESGLSWYIKAFQNILLISANIQSQRLKASTERKRRKWKIDKQSFRRKISMKINPIYVQEDWNLETLFILRLCM